MASAKSESYNNFVNEVVSRLETQSGQEFPDDLIPQLMDIFDNLSKYNPEIQSGSLKYDTFQSIASELEKGKSFIDVINQVQGEIDEWYEQRESLSDDFFDDLSEFFE